MSRSSAHCWLVAVALLIVAQTGAIAHAYAHDLAAPQDQTCASCVTAGHILSACIDNGRVTDMRPCAARYRPAPVERGRSVLTPSPRQRGPPAAS